MGEGVRKIARAFYERAGKDEKKRAREMFKKLDSNGDERISLREFKNGVESGLANDKVFNELDSNGDGALDFDDLLVLFYYKERAITILRCGGSCRQLIFGPSVSCFQCLFNSVDRRYALCRDCYGGAKFRHQHQLSSTSSAASGDLLHDQALLVKLSQLMPKDPKSLSKKDMKKLWETAKSKNGAASPQLEAMANNFFKSVDSDGRNNRVDIQQFSTLMIKQESEFEAFLKPRHDSDFATNFMKKELRRVVEQSTRPSTRPTITTSVAVATTTSTPHITHYANLAPTHQYVNREISSSSSSSSSSNAIVPILKVATTTFKIVDMALTIASLSGMCTIM